MNKRFIKYFWALLLLGMLSGCSDSSVTENSQNASNVINFSVTTSKQSSSDGTTKSRATIVDNDAVRVTGSSFGLYAYSHSDKWAQWKTTQFGTPNLMNDQEVKYENGSWKYTPEKYWTDDNFSFFAYLPYKTSKLLEGTGAAVTASAAANAMPQVEFTQAMDAEKMVDFIASNAINQDKNVGVVGLDFKHVLTRLNFKARLDQELTGNTSTYIFIKDLKICGTEGSTGANGSLKENTASRFFNKATFVLGDGSGTGHEADGQWNYDAATPQKEALELKKLLPIETTTLTSGGTPKDMEGAKLKSNGDTIGLLKPTADLKQHYLFLIPPYGIDGIKNNTDVIVELKYAYVTADPTLGDKFTPVQEKTVAISLPNGTLQQGKAYNIIFTVGLNKVNFDVNVTDWDKDEIEYAPEISAASNDKDGILAAWKKLNDTKTQDETANYFVINVTGAPSDQLNLRSNVNADDFSAFKVGDQVELLFKDGDGNVLTYGLGALVPNGWYYEPRSVNGTVRYIMTKVTNYKTEVSADFDKANIQAALKKLNDAHTDAIHYYAVDIYSAAPSSLDLSSVVPSTDLNNFDPDKDYVYIIFNANGSGDTALTAPDGWELVKVTTETNLCKYRLQKKTTSQTSNIAIGNTGFVAGSTINVNK